MNFVQLIKFAVFANLITSSLTDDNDYEGPCKGSNKRSSKAIDVTTYKFENFLQLQEIYNYMEHLSKSSKYVKILTIGETYEKRPIKIMKIDIDTGACTKRAIILDAGLKPKSWASVSTAVYIMEQLINNKDPDIQYLAKTYVWYIAPVLNPDGYVYTWEGDDTRCWMFNKKPYEKCIGVYLTRNFPKSWYYHEREICGNVFHGDYPASEIESRSWITFLKDTSDPVHGYFHFDTFGGKIWCITTKNGTFERLCRFARQAIKVLNHKHGKKYIVREIEDGFGGTSDSWALHQFADTIAFVYAIEFRGNDSLLPPDEILPQGEEIFASIVSLIFQSEIPKSEYPVQVN